VALRQAEAQLQRDTASASNADAQLARACATFPNAVSRPDADLDTSTAQANALKGTLAADTAAVENARLQLQYNEDPRAGLRARGRAARPRRLPRARQRHAAARHHQSADTGLCQLRRAGAAAAAARQRTPRGTLTVRAAPSGTTADASTGTVTFIDNAVDQATDTVRVKATFTNRDRRLWPGAFVDVTLQLSVNPKAIVVPTSAVQPSQQGSDGVRRQSRQTVEARQVKVA
jgi:multidrug efflux system membrane fusion protein